jgi:hypothetical protein
MAHGKEESPPAYDGKNEKAEGLGSDHMDRVHTVAAIDPALEARITRKFDLHILPWLFGIWLLAFIDRR